MIQSFVGMTYRHTELHMHYFLPDSLTRKAVEYFGKTGELANRIKENALTYVENKFASYIIGNGGWVRLLILPQSYTCRC